MTDITDTTDTTDTTNTATAITNPEPITREYMGHTITLEPRNWEFTVSGPEFSDEKYTIQFKSYEAAKAEITKRHSETERLRMRDISLDVTILNDQGVPTRITRINRATGSLIGVKGRTVYPNVIWIRQALETRTKLLAEIDTLERSLGSREIYIQTNRYYSRIEVDRYAHYVDLFQKEVELKTKNAQEAQGPKEVPAPLSVGT